MIEVENESCSGGWCAIFKILVAGCQRCANNRQCACSVREYKLNNYMYAALTLLCIIKM